MKIKIKFGLIDFLRELITGRSEKQVIIIQDMNYCLEEYLSLGKEKLTIENHTKSYLIFDCNKISDYIELVNTNDYEKYNIILFVRSGRTCLNKITSNFQELNKDLIKITPRNIFSHFYKKLKGEVFDFTFWSGEIFFLNKFIANVCEFIIENVDFYEKLKDDQHSLNKFIISCLFGEINEILFSENFLLYLIEKMILFDSIFYKIFTDDDLKPLKILITSVLRKEINLKDCYDYFINLISKEKLKNFYNLLIILEILSQTSISLVSTVDLKKINEKSNTFLKTFNLDLITDQNLTKLIEISQNFFKYELKTENLYKTEFFIAPFKKSIIIHQIEYNFDFFQLYFDSFLIDHDHIKLISSKRLLYSTLPALGKMMYKKMFRISSKFGNIEDFKELKEDLLAKINYYLECQNENVYYKINLKEFTQHLQYLKNIIEFYQKYQMIENFIKIKNPKSYDFNNWKDIYQYSVIPLDDLYLRIAESKRLFWKINEYDQMVLLLKKKLEDLISILTLDFMDFLYINYPKWVSNTTSEPISVVNVFKNFFKPGETPYTRGDYHLFLIIDCCSLNTWHIVKSRILEDFEMFGVSSIIGTSILPTSTRWARRSLASGDYPINHRGVWYEAEDFFKLISKFPICSLSSQPYPNSYYISHCELLDQNDKAIGKLNNPINFQYCVFNISDESSHSFDLNTVQKIVELTYSTKIKPLLQELLSKKHNPIIYFATDHGISKILDNFDWTGTNFQSYKTSTYIKKENAHPRFFISETKLNPTKKEILKIESNQNDFGLRDKNGYGNNQYYYFATMYESLKKESGSKNVYFAHGGASFFELLIPFAILSKALKKELPPELPSLKKTIEGSNVSIEVNNPYNLPIKKINIHLKFDDYYFKYYINEIDANGSYTLKRDLIDSEGENYTYQIEFYFVERFYSTNIVLIKN